MNRINKNDWDFCSVMSMKEICQFIWLLKSASISLSAGDLGSLQSGDIGITNDDGDLQPLPPHQRGHPSLYGGEWANGQSVWAIWPYVDDRKDYPSVYSHSWRYTNIYESLDGYVDRPNQPSAPSVGGYDGGGYDSASFQIANPVSYRPYRVYDGATDDEDNFVGWTVGGSNSVPTEGYFASATAGTGRTSGMVTVEDRETKNYRKAIDGGTHRVTEKLKVYKNFTASSGHGSYSTWWFLSNDTGDEDTSVSTETINGVPFRRLTKEWENEDPDDDGEVSMPALVTTSIGTPNLDFYEY